MALPRPDLSLGLPTFGEPAGGSWRHLLDAARILEGAGIDRLVVSDHLVLGPHVDRYPWGRFPTPPDADWLDPLSVISALGAVTERIRFLTGILVAPLRPAPVLAKAAATVDVLTGGRLDLGVGVGWQREEFDAVGADFAQRGALLDTTIAECRALWSGQPVPVTGPDGVASEVWSAPVPTQERLPVWFSGTMTRRNLQRIVELGDGWIPIMGASPDDVAAGIAAARAGFAAAERDPTTLKVRAALPVARGADGSPDHRATLAPARELIEAGATDLHLPLRAFVDDVGDRAQLASTATALVAALDAVVA